MAISAEAAQLADIQPWRDLYRREMNCQIVHDSLHAREGWTQFWVLAVGDAAAGYGSIAVGGPWKGKPAIFEFYVIPQFRSRAFDLFQALLAASRPAAIETQTNDPLLTVMLHTFARDVTPESILFHDRLKTAFAPSGVLFRPLTAADETELRSLELDAQAGWGLEVEGLLAAAGGILFHYNPPYGDIYMKVAEPFRRRGLGVYLVQELKRVCRERGNVPAARCRADNVASRKTLQKAGFVPCGHILTGTVTV